MVSQVESGKTFTPYIDDNCMIQYRESAYAIASYVSPSSWTWDPPFITPSSSDPLTILELGSGSGLVGSLLASNYAQGNGIVILTDLENVCPLIEENLRLQGHDITAHSQLFIRPLAWGTASHFEQIQKEILDIAGRKVTHLVCSDLVLSLSFPVSRYCLIESRSISQNSMHHFYVP